METVKLIDKEGSGPVKVLIIPPIVERNCAPLLKMLDSTFKKEFTFYSITPVPRRDNGAVDYEKMLEKCRELIQRVNIDVLYANKQIQSLVLAVLCKEFPRLKGPSVESVFLCNHKYYTIHLVDSREEKLPYHLVGVDKDKYDTAQRLLSTVRLPCVVRACLGTGHSVYCAYNRDQLLKVLEKCKYDVIHIVDIQRWLLQDNIDKQQYPLATRHMVLMTSRLDRFTAVSDSTWIATTAEACVCQKEIIPWALADAVTLPYGSVDAAHFFCGCEMPSKLNVFQQEKLWREFKRDIQNLISRGFDNCFVHAKYMIFEDGNVHLLSISASTHSEATPLYGKALSNGNNVQAAIQLARGIRPKAPTPSEKYVLSYYMMVFESGRADNLIYFDRALKHADVSLRYLPHQDIVLEPAKDYTIIGYITVAGTRFSDCLDKVKTIRSHILKLPELVPLTMTL